MTMDVYALSLSNNQYSSAGVQVSSGEDGAADENAIKIGWEVHASYYYYNADLNSLIQYMLSPILILYWLGLPTPVR